jgi:hypothetical protein
MLMTTLAQLGGHLMRIRRLPVLLVLTAVLVAGPSAAAGASGDKSAIGGGSFLYAGIIPMQFSFGAVQRSDGSTSGSFHHFYVDAGFTYDFWGTVTCMAFDPINHRAWIGGVLTKVTSTDPDVGLVAGDDAWFRVHDSPDGDRATAMGFASEASPSSAVYCALQIWPEGNLRTHPVTSGQIKVMAT